MGEDNPSSHIALDFDLQKKEKEKIRKVKAGKTNLRLTLVLTTIY